MFTLRTLLFTLRERDRRVPLPLATGLRYGLPQHRPVRYLERPKVSKKKQKPRKIPNDVYEAEIFRLQSELVKLRNGSATPVLASW